ncbi:MAG: hypothetical protein CR988_06320 [Treponema sp.]|nr:MAG: hypothetical protein CR988_06320 [Treponema sp.]
MSIFEKPDCIRKFVISVDVFAGIANVTENANTDIANRTDFEWRVKGYAANNAEIRIAEIAYILQKNTVFESKTVKITGRSHSFRAGTKRRRASMLMIKIKTEKYATSMVCVFSKRNKIIPRVINATSGKKID